MGNLILLHEMLELVGYLYIGEIRLDQWDKRSVYKYAYSLLEVEMGFDVF